MKEKTKELYREELEKLQKAHNSLKAAIEKEQPINKDEDSVLEKVLLWSKEFIQFTDDTPDYNNILQNMLDISGAKYAALNVFDEDGFDFTTVAFVGIKENIQKGLHILGFDVQNKHWNHDPVRAEKTKKQSITRFMHLHELTGDVISKNIILLLEGKLGIEESFVVKVVKDKKVLGDFTLMFEKGTTLKNSSYVELYANQVGLFLARSKSQQVLKESEDKIRNILENTASIFYSHTPDHVLTYLSPQIKDMLGYTQEEAMIKWTKLVSDNPINEIGFQNTVKAIETGKRQPIYNLELVKKNGERIWVEVRENPIVENGMVVSIVGSISDVTERFQAEQALKETQLLLASIIDSQKDTIIFSIDKNYNYLTFNKAHKNAMKFAWNVDVKLGMNILDCIKSDDERLLAKKNFDRTLKGESHSNIQIFGSANPAYYESFFNPIRDDNNEIIACAGLARNITQRMQDEKNLKERESEVKERNKELNGIYTLGLLSEKLSNLEDIYNEFVNHVAPKSMQFPDKTIVLLELDGKKYCNNDDFSLERNKSYLTAPIIVFGKEIGNLIFTYIEDLPFIDVFEQNLINSYAERISKITERIVTMKTLEENKNRLSQLNADKDRFISILGHDLKNPFSNILGLSEILTGEINSLEKDEITDIAGNINKSAQITNKLLDDILMWARAQQGKIPFKPQHLKLKDICKNNLEIFSPNAKSKNITINCNTSEEINIYADIDMLKTVLRNLVSNAIKFTNKGGSININAEHNSENVTISVSDNGVGIEPKSLKKLFDISEFISTKGTAGETGTGLGLLLCKEFVEKHGGEIWAESEVGKGSDFKFTMPIYKE